MKYVTFLIDGMADISIPELNNRTPLEYAYTPNMDKMAANAVYGTFLTLPKGYSTSSDVANMSILGWDLAECLTGRGAIESYGAGIELDDRTVAFRMNLITVKDDVLIDYSAGHISEDEAGELIDFLKQEMDNDQICIRKGVSYRNLLYLQGEEFTEDVDYEKPDSSHGQYWEDLLPCANDPKGVKTAELLVELIYKSMELLEKHPVNLKRIAEGKNPANLIWPWSGGSRPKMPSFNDLYGKKGAVVSAVEVILGLGRLGKMTVIKPEGATGWIDTNYENKAHAGIELLKDHDFVYIHIEAVDECGHLGDLKLKIQAIEDIDRRLIGPFIREYAEKFSDDLRMMILPDHPVPVSIRAHTRDKVPFIISGSNLDPDPNLKAYNEKTALQGKYADLKGRELMDLFFSEKTI
ncbi:MAG: cofactor-independent phosphoglycerate mutase [Spirochaetes bacterium GWF1_51_8]|nr:MAG: cofactor-independent phosphoglycerate mutase [Spirochaetes bacterium GWF1_51_8]